MSNTLTALSVIAGVLSAFYLKYIDDIKRFYRYKSPEHPENLSAQNEFKEFDEVFFKNLIPLFITTTILVVTLLPVSIEIITSTIKFICQNGYKSFQLRYYKFPEVIILLIHIYITVLFTILIKYLINFWISRENEVKPNKRD